MRRISLALALMGAVAAAGCGGAGGTTPASSDANKGVEQASFKLVVRGEGAFVDPANNTTIILPKGGVVTASAGSIDCGVDGAGTLHKTCEALLPYDNATSVTVTATPNAPTYTVWGWAGACSGTGACSLMMTDTKFVGVRFATSTAGLGAHAAFTDPAIHGQEFFKAVDADGVFLSTTAAPAGSYNCTACHGGAPLLGSGLAPSCASCHNWPITKGGHFNPAGAMAGHGGAGCGRCHNTDNFRDFTGADGTFAEYVSSVVFTGSQVLSGSAYRTPGQMHCDTCHNSKTDPAFGSWTNQKKFANGNVLTLDSASAICAQCHDGARPNYNVAQIPLNIGTQADPDGQISTTLGGSNATVRAHYLSGASTVYGKEAGNWYQYSGKVYTGRNEHGGKNQCTFCHDAHDGSQTKNAQVAAKCGVCHAGEDGKPVATFAQLEETRQYGFEGDIDGDGVSTSLKVEIDGLGAKLYAAIQAYALNVSGTGICNLSQADNKFYVVSDAGVACGTAPNNTQYNKYTPRLLKAAYNFLMYQQDAGAWAHNPRYAIEVLFDTITDLNAGLTAKGKTPVAFNGFRTFEGHFGAATATDHDGTDVFRDWDSAGAVPNNCSQCHAGQQGIINYLADQNTALTNAPVTGMQCGTCHTPNASDTNFKRMRAVAVVNFPPRKAAAKQVAFDPSVASTFLTSGDRVCMTCHTGRENKTSIDDKNGTKLNTDWSISFTNPHYLGAAGVLLGSNTHMMYEYAGKTYAGYPINWGSPHGSPHGQSCTGCHRPQASKHSFEVDLTWCNSCHVKASYGDFRLPPKQTNVQRLSDQLYATIQAYSQAAGKAVCYSAAYPYWFGDNGYVDGVSPNDPVRANDGICDAQEAVSANGAKLNPAAAKAAFNYKWSKAEPGAYAHNYEYVAQALIDSILDLDPAATLPYDSFFDPANTTTEIERP